MERSPDVEEDDDRDINTLKRSREEEEEFGGLSENVSLAEASASFEEEVLPEDVPATSKYAKDLDELKHQHFTTEDAAAEAVNSVCRFFGRKLITRNKSNVDKKKQVTSYYRCTCDEKAACMSVKIETVVGKGWKIKYVTALDQRLCPITNDVFEHVYIPDEVKNLIRSSYSAQTGWGGVYASN